MGLMFGLMIIYQMQLIILKKKSIKFYSQKKQQMIQDT